MTQTEEKIVYQYTTNYKAYRRFMISTRATATVVAVGAAMGLIALSWVLALIAAIALLCIGAISIIVSLHNEKTVMVFDTRVVIKNKVKRVSVDYADMTAVSYKLPFYERDLLCGTVTVVANTKKGKTKKYRARHIFDAAAGVAYMRNQAEKLKDKGEVGNAAEL